MSRYLSVAVSIVVSVACGSPPSFSDSGDSGDSDSDGNDSDGMAGSTNTGGSGFNVDGDGGTSSGGGGDVDTAVCGNGELEIGELCDDGDEDNGDGCSSDCLEVDDDYLCLEEGEPCERVVTCGNGILEGTEVCDDGNDVNGDGCGDCAEIQDGYSCSKPGTDCVIDPVCGNGTRERGEGCDDGEATPDDGDGCDSACQAEAGFFCPPGQACVPLECGDGNRTPDEACDDGDQADDNGCSSTCTVEDGWYCSASGCKALCGDGVVLGLEDCDDGAKVSGDGCSAACKVEPFYTCDDGEPTMCVSDIVCGDGTRDPGEVCDPGVPGEEACYDLTENPGLACKGFETILPPAVCGDLVIQYLELCDGDGDGDPLTGGCINCVVQPGYVCPKGNYCVRQPDCGDGFITFQSGEVCDAGIDPAEGCVGCQVEPNYYCSGEPSVCVESVCGDGVRAPDEQCDDGELGLPGDPEDGCDANCQVDDGWVCPPGVDCVAECGDGFKKGNEECDSPDTTGCRNCRLLPNYQCGATGEALTCTKSVCGNGIKEAGEGCDPAPGNLIAGDGCGPTCQNEPTFSGWPNPTIPVDERCGDGLKLDTESCDDGNKVDGDGCSSLCAEETGWDCTQSASYPDSIAFKISYRDFKHRNESGGHPHMRQSNTSPPDSGNDFGMVGPLCTSANQASCGKMDGAGKPIYGGATTSASAPATGIHPTIDPNGDNLAPAYHWNAFNLWYRDTNPAGAGQVLDPGNVNPILIAPNPGPCTTGGGVCAAAPAASTTIDTIALTKTSNLGNTALASSYRFSQATNIFYPLGSASGPTIASRGFGYTPNSGSATNRNWNWTSELRYYFQYQGGETLTFFGDDDVFVFINGRLAVDIGGIHGTIYGRVVLGDSDSSCTTPTSNGTYSGSAPAACTRSGTEAAEGADARFVITKGNVYEIVVFQAERHPTGSNYQLTLDGFIAPRSTCNTTCGDGDRAGSEVCDDGDGSPNGGGMPASGYGTCLYVAANDPKNCTFEFCGDGDAQGPEDCDDGTNGATYGSDFETDCAPGCVWAPYCGDGILQSSREECDDGVNDGSFGTCNSDCTLAPYCGDKLVEPGEEDCDPLDGEFVPYDDGTAGNCGYDCQFAPNCGDDIRNGPEICDDGVDNGTVNSDCNDNCEFDPFCGDGLKTMDEECDYGDFGYSGAPDDAPYGGCTTMCLLGPYCGDEATNDDVGEECDEGADNDDNEYEGCSLACLLGPHCGDGTTQAAAGEDCDNGFNEDDYSYPGSSGACGDGCQGVPYCGDGDIQAAFELCDDGGDNDDDAYDGCTTVCDWGPYCGDGTENGPEECDDGLDNVAYSPDGEGCSYDCETDVPYCGDGVRNGPEQCDLGTSANDGEYGGCKGDCTRAPFCGDKKVQTGEGEQCDDGPAGSLACTPICSKRDTVK